MPATDVLRPLGRHGVQDVAVGLLVAAAGLAELWVPFPSVQGEGDPVISTVVVLAIATMLVFRRRAPLATQVAVVGTFSVLVVGGWMHILFWGAFVPEMVATYSVARHGRGRAPLYGLLVGAASWLLVDLRVELLQGLDEMLFHWTVFLVAWAAGLVIRRKETSAERAFARAVAAEVSARETARLAVADERARIARELHDVIAHSVSVMVVQAGAAEQRVRSDPETAGRALATIRRTGQETLAEVRRVLQLVRADEDLGPAAPQPGLAALPRLVEEAGYDGLAVELAVDGETAALPPGLDLAAYRIVQEALTNVRRHAEARTARVRVRVGGSGEALEIEVTDDGHGAGGATRGHGLTGMAERTRVYGGRLELGDQPDGGFRVHAALPLTSTGVGT